VKSTLLVLSAAELITAPEGEGPLVGAALDAPLILHDAAIACVDGRIAAVGPTAEIAARYPEREAAEVLDARDHLIAPGFVDCHTHLPFAGTREAEFDARARGERYEAIAAKGGGIRASARQLRDCTGERLAELVGERLAGLPPRGGATGGGERGHRVGPREELKQLRALARASKASPDVEIVPTFLGAHEVPDDYRERRDAYVRLLIETMIPAVAAEKLARYCDVFCDRGVFTVEESRRILEAGRSRGLTPKLHADELADVGAASLAAELRAASADHLLHANDAGLRAMAAAGVIAVLLPGTALTLGLPYARARDMIAMGLAVAIATDFNPGSTFCSSMPLMLTLAVTQMHLSPAEAWMAATANAAEAVGAGRQIGRIAPGRQADFVLFETPDYRHIPYHYGRNHARITVKRGRVVHRRGDASICR